MSAKTRKIVFTAILAALTTVFTLISFPLATGYYNFGDIVVFIAAILLGPICGALVGGIGGALGDLALSYVPYMPFTLVIKALEGFIAGALFKAAKKTVVSKKSKIVTEAILATLINIFAGCVMALGYFLAEGLLLSEGKWSGGIVNLPFNVLQGAISAVVAVVILYPFKIKKLFDKLQSTRAAIPPADRNQSDHVNTQSSSDHIDTDRADSETICDDKSEKGDDNE